MSLQKQTKNSWHRPDPSFTYLLSFFLLLTSIAWGLAYADGFSRVLRLTLAFIFVHFIGSSLLIATISYFVIGRLLRPGVPGLPGRRRQGLFTQLGDEEQLEFGYCFDVSIRAFFPVWFFLYVVQFLLMPLIAKEYWYVSFPSKNQAKSHRPQGLTFLRQYPLSCCIWILRCHHILRIQWYGLLDQPQLLMIVTDRAASAAFLATHRAASRTHAHIPRHMDRDSLWIQPSTTFRASALDWSCIETSRMN
jgi:hypothetical protein